MIIEAHRDTFHRYHNDSGPAIIWDDGMKMWYIRGKLHREDGPAVECPNGLKEWYLENKEYSEEEHARMVNLKVFW